MSHIGDTLRGQGIVFNISAPAHWSVNPSSLGQTWGSDHTADTERAEKKMCKTHAPIFQLWVFGRLLCSVFVCFSYTV